MQQQNEVIQIFRTGGEDCEFVRTLTLVEKVETLFHQPKRCPSKQLSRSDHKSFELFGAVSLLGPLNQNHVQSTQNFSRNRVIAHPAS